MLDRCLREVSTFNDQLSDLAGVRRPGPIISKPTDRHGTDRLSADDEHHAPNAPCAARSISRTLARSSSEQLKDPRVGHG